MNIREWLNNNSAVVTIVAVLVLCFALAFIIWNNAGGNRVGPVDVYFVDLNTNEIFVASSNQIPPIEAPADSGGQASGVRVHIYSCGECPDLTGSNLDELGGDVFVAYLERYTDEARAVLSGETELEDEERYYGMTEMGQLVRAPGGSRWVQSHSEAGYQLMGEIGERCGRGNMPTLCRP